MKQKFLPAVLAAALTVGAVAPPAATAQVNLPSLGESSSEDFGVGTERKLGDQIMREVRRDLAYLDDPLLLEYVQSLWKPLLASARQRGEIGNDLEAAFAWETFLVSDRSVNAFALPGGFVGVHLGLIAMTGSRDELASVLAHEMSHVTQRHIARSMANSARQSIMGLAALVLGMVAAARAKSPEMGQAAIAGSQAAVIQGQLNFSRDMEREADRIGWSVYSGAGFAPEGVAQMFEKMDAAYRLNDNNAYPYLRSHPLTVERIGEARARVEAAPRKPGAPAGVLEHAIMQARAKVLMDTSVQGLRRHLAEPRANAAPTERLGALYMAALAALMLREPARAQAPLDAAAALVRSSPHGDARAARDMRLLQAEVLAAGGDAAKAAALLDNEPAGDFRPQLLLRADLSLRAARANAAARDDLRRQTETLQAWVAEHRDDALAWSQLAQSAEALGLTLRSLRAQAESRAALGDIAGAVDRLRAAQRMGRGNRAGTPDFIESSIVDARLRELEAKRRQLERELKGGRE
jgi:predicted Zn-dependent protease